MSRFLFYLIIINMLTNMVSITPRILIAGSAKGTILSMIVALILGIWLTYILVILFRSFPGQDLPEILHAYAPKWMATPVLLFLSVAWYVAGLFTIIIYTFIILRFLTPEMSIYVIVLTFAIVVTYGVFMATKNILYMSEIIFVLVVPFIIFIQIKGYISPELNWDYVRIALMEFNHLPDYGALTSSLFIVVGTANLVIFNRVFLNLKKLTGKGTALLAFICTYVLATTYFLPIGFGGFDSLENVLYPWIMTSDSIRMKFGIIERVVFLFIGAFLALGVVSIIIHWHVSIQLLSSVIQFKRFKWRKFNLTNPLIMVIFWVVAMVVTKSITAEGLFKAVEMYDDFVLPALLLLLVGSLLVAKKGAASKWRESKK
ncbi:GerAB/ArcD/ProY family transporter [Sporosarcina luteola]|uniref:GerAB/ArcD/ProY family transporter n=1 Tax=Sporosarcina luteola TaxID=582850 RepID=UPI0020402D95|nr:GerAB/ArcD/ProY family transporter [Sporosarcina luteola]MCM3745612.1 GerAB/ArcD/ProY family transporter [Sporosarcina luteola]